MIAVVLALTLAQAPDCAGEGLASLTAGWARAEVLDLAGAAVRFRDSLQAGCSEAELPAVYSTALLAAREASRQGGSAGSLAPVREAAATLAARARELPVTAEIARFVLLAAAAAAQSERDDMALFLAQAIRLEGFQKAANQPLAPVISAHEIAGDLWLQVHRYEDARRAYQVAATTTGTTPRVTLGLARAAARLRDAASACAEYGKFLTWWGSRADDPPEVTEARTYAAGSACRAKPETPAKRR